MKVMVASGVPAIIVSHQLERIASLCNNAILLTQGRVVYEGAPAECIAAYARHQSVPAPATEGANGLRLESIVLEARQPVPSGDRIDVVIHGDGPPEQDGRRRMIGLRVRSLQTGDVVFATGTVSHQVELPPGPFELAIGLQMNVPAGIYAIESSVGHWQRERDARNGPATLVHVAAGAGFVGQVQLNCAMRVRSATRSEERSSA